jgi:hypothetical protein
VSRGLLRIVLGAVTAQAVVRGLERQPPGDVQRWRRTNYRGHEVSLAAGPALAAAVAITGAGPAGAVAAAGAGLSGRYDDVHGDASAKGFRGHVGALQERRLTSGAVKLLGISASSLLAAACMRPRRDVLLSGAVIAGTANLLNLLDLRPGRALKSGVAGGLLLAGPGVVASCAALLPSDLAERRMLGDCGANALGAALGVRLVQRVRSRPGRLVALGALVGLTAASERVSFSEVIDRTPVLRRIDQAGRLP